MKPKTSYSSNWRQTPQLNVNEHWLNNQKKIALKNVQTNQQMNQQDRSFGIKELPTKHSKKGWLVSLAKITVFDKEKNQEKSGLKLYFVDEENCLFSARILVEPYFYLKTKSDSEFDLETSLNNLFPGFISSFALEEKVDLDLNNHLSGLKQIYARISFPNEKYQEYVAQKLQKNLKIHENGHIYKSDKIKRILGAILEVREYDVLYLQKAMTERDLRVGVWYEVTRTENDQCEIVKDPENIHRPKLKICAFDIETMKAPLRFPDAEIDEIMMISLMIGKQGFLIVNRSVVSQDIEDFEYTPKKQFPGPFRIFNEENEICLLQRFFTLLQQENPSIYVTYNGDFFDWPYIEKRSLLHGFSIEKELGIYEEKKTYRGRFSIHIDAFCWVKRDSYLPIGSQGLKAVTKEKLRYNPVEVEPELMVEFAQKKPQSMAAYSVSDAVATFYLYTNYVHSFIFSLCTIIPLPAHHVLRKGSGTLCEALLMAEAFKSNIIAPNKQFAATESFHSGRLVDQETYVGGHVECIEAGVFREDIPMQFLLDDNTLSSLAEDTEKILRFAAAVENKLDLSLISNFDQLKNQISSRLLKLAKKKRVTSKPLIYHFDVISMYPNIILSNRLQPVSIVTKADCASCDFNLPENDCKRKLGWKWRGKLFPVKKMEYEHIKAQLEVEELPGNLRKKGVVRFSALRKKEREEVVLRRVKEYSRKAYKRVTDTVEEVRESVICQRENSFYVDAVRSFRDRRYTLKKRAKEYRLKSLEADQSSTEIKKATEMAVIFDSMQLAHKCILNSFYGYVMRRSSRWYSMPMAAITTHLGAAIIKNARELLEKFSRPLELDTDGVWCCVPSDFPVKFEFVLKSGEKKAFSFICSALNVQTHSKFSNKQYQNLEDPNEMTYSKQTECSIFFEEDGPYRCMLLPASAEEGKTLKKRYAVFSKEGELVELKGFELKRRGELKIMKILQTEVFQQFLKGSTLQEVYSHAAETSNYWLDIIYRKGADLRDDEIFDLFSENKNMSRDISDYQKDRSTSITCAKRLQEFLGKTGSGSEGLSLRFIISRFPQNASVSDRAIPTVIYQAKKTEMRRYLNSWCRETLSSHDVREVIDWEYYKNRIGLCIQKIVTIPAAIQKIPNPVLRVPYPKWLNSKIRNKLNPFGQSRIQNFFAISQGKTPPGVILSDRNDERKDFEPIDPPIKSSRREIDIPTPAKKIKSGKGSQLQKTQLLTTKTWQLLKVEKTADLGVYRAWIITADDAVRRVEIEVKRSFLLNRYHSREKAKIKFSEVAEKGIVSIKKVRKILPRGIQAHFTYQLNCPEGIFQQKKCQFLREFTLAENEGVYESFSSLEFRILSRLGNFAKVKKKIKKIKENLRFEDLRSHKDKKSPYEYLSIPSLQTVFLYQSKLGNRGAICLFCGDAKELKFSILLINPTKIADFDEMNVERLIPKELKRIVSLKSQRKKLVVAKSQHVSLEKASETLKRMLKNSGGKSRSVLVHQTETDLEEICPMAKGEFPSFQISFHQSDLEYPAFRWTHFLASIAMKRFLVALQWWDNQLALARFSKIPIGNLGVDNVVQMADIMFLRALEQKNCAVWSSDRLLPDLSGKEMDQKSPLPNLTDLPILNAGVYRNFCVEIEISFLCVCAILTNDAVERLEVDKTLTRKIADTSKASAQSKPLKKTFRRFGGVSGETRSLEKTFRVLKEFVEMLAHQVASKDSDLAELLLDNLYRWLCSEDSECYEPNLLGYVQLLMKKYLNEMIKQLKKTGAVIVFASFTKLTISTDKSAAYSALAYVNSLIESLKEMEIFSLLGLQPRRAWRTLAFLGEEDFAGVKSELAGDVAEEIEMVSQWNICEFVPTEIEKCFQVVLTMFLIATLKESMKGKGPNKGRRESVAKFTRELVDTKITNYLFANIPALKRRLANVTDDTNPFRSGGDVRGDSLCGRLLKGEESVEQTIYDPTLMLINFIGRVMSLDKDVEDEVNTLKNSLLRLVNVAQFSPEAHYREPCLTFKLEGVICDYCGAVLEVDLCKSQTVRTGRWECETCGNPCGVKSLEVKLVGRLMGLVRGFVGRESSCVQCGKTRRLEMSVECECSGRFEGDGEWEAIVERLRLFYKMATFYKLEWLCEEVKSVYKMINK